MILGGTSGKDGKIITLQIARNGKKVKGWFIPRKLQPLNNKVMQH